MGLLEYQAMPSLRDAAVLCTFSNRSAPDQGKWCGPQKEGMWSSLLPDPARTPGPVQPKKFGRWRKN
jgi:hypothetical protein